jgi:hypothetical protein
MILRAPIGWLLDRVCDGASLTLVEVSVRLLTVKWALVAGFVGLACSSFSDRDDVGKRTFENNGSVCASWNGDHRLRVFVRFPTCLSSSCDRAGETGCEITLSGDVITIESHGESTSTGETSCTADCGSLTAECTSADPIDEGTYQVLYGDQSSEISLPFTTINATVFEDPSSGSSCQ